MRKGILAISGIVFIAAVSLLTGCATMTPEKMEAEISGYELPQQAEENSSLVYIVRPGSLGTLVRFNVFLDDKKEDSEMGYTRGSQYIYFFVSPGKHNIYSKAENWAETDIDVEAGEIVFIRQITDMGIIMARNSLVTLDDIEGKYYVKTCSLGTIKKKKK
jgi:hypothetical protein